MSNYLEYMHEDANFVALKGAIVGAVKAPADGKFPGAVAKDGKGPKNKNPSKVKKDLKAGGKVPGAVADKGKGKGKGKDKDKGKPSAAAGGPGTGTGQQSNIQSLRDKAENTPPNDRTDAQKALLGCRFHSSGNCYAGDKCKYSHAEEDIKRTMKRAYVRTNDDEELGMKFH